MTRIDELARRLYLDCLLQLHDAPALISHFDPPQSDIEAIHLMDGLWSEKKYDRLAQVLQLPITANTNDVSLIEVRTKYAARLKS